MATRGRPRIPIDLEQAFKLGTMHCTLEECSAWLGVNLSTLSCRPDFMESYRKGKEQGKMSLRRYQWALAKTNVSMAIWLGKQYLNQSDNPQIIEDRKDTITLEPDKLADDGTAEV